MEAAIELVALMATMDFELELFERGISGLETVSSCGFIEGDHVVVL